MTVLDSSLVRGADTDRPAGHDRILIIDFGSQVTQLIARRVREEKVYCEIVPFQKADEAFRAMRPKGVILSGGPASVLDRDAPLAPPAVYEAGVPILGICYGHQLLARDLAGRVEPGTTKEYGHSSLHAGEELMAVADAEDRHAEIVDRPIDRRAGRRGDARRPARDDDPARAPEVGGGTVDVGHDGVNAQLANAAGDEVAVLAARVEDDDLVHGQRGASVDAPASAPAGRPCPRS